MRPKQSKIQDPAETVELFETVLDSSTEYGIIATDLKDRIIVWNKGAERIYGYDRDEMTGRRLPAKLHKKDAVDGNILFLVRNIFHSDIIDQKMNAVRKDGSVVPVSVTITHRVDKSNKMQGYLIIVRDITRTKLHELSRDVLLEVSHIINSSNSLDEMCQLVVNSISNFLDIPIIYICIYDGFSSSFAINSHKGLRRDFCSHSCSICFEDDNVPLERVKCYLTACELTINSEELSDHIISRYIANRDIAAGPTSIIHIPLASDTTLVGMLHIVVSTERKNFLLTESQVLSLLANGITAGIQRKRLEEENRKYADDLERMVQERTVQLREKDAQLVQSGKLATLGEMAAGIAHEINQPLGGISLMAQGLLMAKERGKLSDGILDEKLSSIVVQIERINRIITHLRSFARQSGDNRQQVNVNKPLSDVFELIGQQLKNRDIQYVLHLSEPLPPVMADHTRLEQVFLNIISNARDALDDFEETVEALKAKPSMYPWLEGWDKRISVKSYSTDGMVCIEIADNAGGIPRALINKIFDPFFTTKEVGKGTGLGLSISYGIVREFGGVIEVESEEMKGSRFVIKFPAVF